MPLATNFTVATACATPRPGCVGGMAASNVLFNTIFGYSANGGYQHWWLPNLRSTIAAGVAHQDINSQLIGPSQASLGDQGAVERLRQSGVEPGRVHHHRRPVHVWQAHHRCQRQGPRAGADRQMARRFLGAADARNHRRPSQQCCRHRCKGQSDDAGLPGCLDPGDQEIPETA